MYSNKRKLRQYRRLWYSKNSSRAKHSVCKRKVEIKKWLIGYKKSVSCIKCGEKNAACLQFHHRNPDDKKMEIATALANGWCIKRILTEIEKCDVLCANCHQKIHYEKFYL